CMQGIQFSLTF
nr:immunoglobulin light chain junction region [Macaca mulatta]